MLVDLGKVVGVLRTSHPVQRDYPELNNQDNDDVEEVPDLDFLNENANISSGGGAESMVLSSRTAGGCASCAAAAAAGGKHLKTVVGVGPGELDDSLCGDPLMYATFVAPVHQYSTETEPSRQTSFNFPSSRQPSFKQNSSEADPCAQHQTFLGGQLSIPRCSSSGSGNNYDRSGEVRDIYEEVPTIDRWPLPPLPREEPHDLAEICSVEISQEELEQQLHMERMSFMSSSSAAEEEEEELYDEKDNSLHLPPPPPPAKPSFLHRNHHHAKDFIFDTLVKKPYRQVNSPQAKVNLQCFSAEDSDGNELATVAGTVRRKVKRERNKTTTGVLTDSKDNLCEQQDSMIGTASSSGRPSLSPCSSSMRKNSFKRNKQSRNKGMMGEQPHYAAPHSSHPPPVPPHQTLYKPQSHPDLDCPKGRAHNDFGRLASPDQFSESSASFHENELVGSHTTHPLQQKWVQPLVTRSSDSSVTAEVHPLPQSRRHQQRRKTPPPAQFSNRDSVRESWISSESEPFATKAHVLTNRSYQHLQGIESSPSQRTITLDLNSPLSRAPRSQRDLLLQSGLKLKTTSSSSTTSTTFPRFTRSVTNLASVTPTTLSSSAPMKPIQQHTHSRSHSRESGSSSSHTGSRKDLLRGGGGYFDQERQNQKTSTSMKNTEQKYDDDNDGKNNILILFITSTLYPSNYWGFSRDWIRAENLWTLVRP